MNRFFRNPLIRRYAFSHLRKWNVIVTLGVYFTVLALINMMCALYIIRNAGAALTVDDMHRVASFATPWLGGIAVLLLWALASNAPAAVLTNQSMTGAQMFFDLLPLSGKRKAWGLLLGANILYYPLSILTLFIGFQYALAAGFSFYSAVTILCCVVGLGMFFNTMALLASAASLERMAKLKLRTRGGNNISSGVAIMLLFFLLGAPALIGMATSFKSADALTEYSVFFFVWKIPLLWFLAVVAALLASWCFYGAARKLGPNVVPLFSRAGAVLFLVFAGTVALGLLWRFFAAERHPEQFVAIFSLIMVPGVLLLCVGGSKRSRDLREAIYAGAVSGKSRGRRILNIVLNSNSALSATLIAVFLAFNAPLWMWMWISDARIVVSTAGFFASTVLFLVWVALAWELYNLFKVEYGYKHFVVGFAVALYFAIPFIAGVVSGDPFLLSLNPLGYFIVATVRHDYYASSMTFESIPALVAMTQFCAIAVTLWLVYRKYVSIWTATEKAVRGADSAEGDGK